MKGTAESLCETLRDHGLNLGHGIKQCHNKRSRP